MSHVLQGFKVAILIANGFAEIEMTKPKQALEDLGAIVHIISPETGKVKGWDCDIPKETIQVSIDVPLDNAKAEDYNALLIPGGYGSPEELRLNEKAISFVQGFANKPIAAICHGPVILINTKTKLVYGKKLTSYQAVQEDFRNAGAQWIDKEVVKDGNLITSRGVQDIPAFISKMIELFTETHAKKNRKEKC
jgi:protease I